MVSVNKKCSPFVKWAGGKRKLISQILPHFPKEFNNYFEPFIGGGAVIFEIQNYSNIQKFYISDLNSDLINLYLTVKNKPEKLLSELKIHENNEEYFYKIRNLDRDEKIFSKLTDIQKASRFLYLNKTAFNGLYRVNSKNQFNVPFGKYKNPNYADSENILKCSQFLKKVNIFNQDFEEFKKLIKKGDFIYFDPPYFPVNKTSSFTSYTQNGFDLSEQKRLLNMMRWIDSIGAYFLLSNAHTEETLDFYKEFKIIEVETGRSINSKAQNRGKIKEILVKNY